MLLILSSGLDRHVYFKTKGNSPSAVKFMCTNQHANQPVSSDENKKYIQSGDNMKILIQLLTETQHEELSKTVKYLLHMCVATGV